MDEAVAPDVAEEAPEVAAAEPTTAVAPPAPPAVVEAAPTGSTSIPQRVRRWIVMRKVGAASQKYSKAAEIDANTAVGKRRLQETKAQESNRLAQEAEETAARLRAEAEQALRDGETAAQDASRVSGTAAQDAEAYDERADAERQAAAQIRQLGESYLAAEAELRAQVAAHVADKQRIKDEQVELTAAEQYEIVNAAAEKRDRENAQATQEREAADEVLRIAQANRDAAATRESEIQESGDKEVADVTTVAQNQVSRVVNMHTRYVNRTRAEGEERIKAHRKGLDTAIREAARVAAPEAPQEAEIA